MELASVQSSSAVDDLPKPPWFSTPRPTIVTALPSHATIERFGRSQPSPFHLIAPIPLLSMAPIPYLTSPDLTTPYSVRRTAQYSLIPHSRFLQSTFPTLPHGHSWADLFSSPLNPDLFAHLAATGVLGPVASTSNVQSLYPDHNLRSTCWMFMIPNKVTLTHFISPSHPSFQDKRNLATSPYDESKSRRPIMADASATIPRSAGAKSSGLKDSKRDIHDDIRAHSRRGSAGKVFCKSSVLECSNSVGLSGSTVSSTYLPNSYATPSDYDSNPDITAGRSNAGLPPSLWMSPTSSSPSVPSIHSYASFHL
jgi:hypothetical protein